MATIVQDKRTKKTQYVLLGAGFGAWQSASPSVLFGDWSPQRRRGNIPVLIVCDAEGKVGWLATENSEVVSVDGRPPGELLG